ncbi:nucleotidyltransferase domain-containing protein [Candidatus Woesearchaeota archaeon]|nr:nucleotidyltransferase domain-containing protein [Candidatus Woesearchaeota archaeon]
MITEDNTLRVLRVFLESPEKKFHIRQIARLTGLSSTGAIKIIKKLKKNRLLNSEKKRMTEEVEANWEGRFQQVKRAYNILSLYDTGLMPKLRDFYQEPKAIVLFGSYGEGTDTSASDIDIAVITQKKELPELDKFEKKLKRKIRIITTTLETATKEFKNALANGIVLSGYNEIAK